MPASAALVSITISYKDSLIVTFERRGETPLPVSTNLTHANIGEYLDSFYKELDGFLNSLNVGLTVSDFSIVSKAMLDLHRIGRTLNRQLFRNGRYEVEGFFKRAWPEWRLLGADTYRPPLVQLMTRIEHMLPLEFFPMFNTEFPPAIRNLDDLIEVAARFLGFSTTVHRIYLRSDEQSRQDLSGGEFENMPRLGVRFFQHAGLTGARREREFFEDAQWVDLRGSWPDQLFEEPQFIYELAAKLWNCSHGAIEGEEAQLDQIQHFACHCDTDKLNSLDYSLQLLHRDGLLSRGSVRNVSIKDLEGEFGGFPKRQSEKPYPLVFLNACGASKLTPKGVTSFPRLFRGMGNRGVIGTEASIPDIFAAEFSKLFYLNLIRGETLGDAVHLARATLLKNKNNPLGILYTVYANPDLRVRRPQPEATAPASRKM